jgi:nucleotide-binding universal stress UspA family protein
MKNILVLVHDDAGQEARLNAGINLARALEGHLTCLDVAVAPSMVGAMDDFAGTAIVVANAQHLESRNRARIEPRLRNEKFAYDWIDTVGFLSPSVRSAAGLVDLIVLNRELDADQPDMREVVGNVLIGSGKPVVAVPQATRGFDVFGHALIAWDGSPEAEAALQAAVPLLRLARAVTIIEVVDGSARLPVGQAATYLARHGIRSDIRIETPAFDIPSTVILDAIGEIGAAYLVMGGYGHSRFREAAFGGVTRRMIAECPVPLFMMH